LTRFLEAAILATRAPRRVFVNLHRKLQHANVPAATTLT